DSLLTNPSGDMFWMYPAVACYFNCRAQLNAQWRARFRETLKRYTPYRGDTENHFLMHYSTLLLFSQEWPEMTGDEWFNGKSSRENYAEAADYLNHWIDETVRYGTTEWDSPRYLYFYITPLLTLRDFTADTLLRRRCDMMLEYQLADYAAEYLNGSYCGAHSRDGDNSVINPRNSEAASYGQFYFEDSLAFILPDLAFAACSNFHCPPIISAIAHDRDTAFVHTERKRSRARIRFADGKYAPAMKYDYITPDYGIGSVQGGLLQPIQQHSWSVTFASARPNNTLFGLHPQVSATELGMFFPEEPELMVEGVSKSKASYGSELKWVGGSPYERIFQDSGTLIALYDIPPSALFPHTDLFFPNTLDTLIRDASGWIFCRMERAFVAVRPLGGTESDRRWTEETACRRLQNRSLANGYIIECASEREMSFERFMEKLRPLSIAIADPMNGFTYRSLRGTTISAIAPRSDPSAGTPRLLFFSIAGAGRNAGPQVGSDLFHGPNLRSAYESGVLEMRCHGATRTLDFIRSEVRR
ncbi:MAG: hypothetical protein ABI876_02920, partial [Bacteroidota bacterium]